MHRIFRFSIGLALFAVPAPAMAQAACPEGLICASDPQTVASAIQDLGYKARLGEDSYGDPMIESSASGYDFTVEFYGCREGRNCQSLRFIVKFEDDGTNTPEMANAWNKQKRFSQMSALDDGRLAFAYDLSTTGGVNKQNFADVFDWWQLVLTELRKFFAEQAG